MTVRRHILIFAMVTLFVLGATAAYGLHAYDNHQDALAAAAAVDKADYDSVSAAPRIVFRNTAIGNDYGLVATVALSHPKGPRAVVDVACDRVDATATAALCLRTNRGVATTFEAAVLDADWNETESWPLPGVPSRTRLSADGALGASTSFVTGHSYMTTGFSTATTIRELDGEDYGDLEKFDLTSDGRHLTAVDLNVWGVTFASDDNTFYATASFKGENWIVRGDLETRTLTTLFAGGECPSLSPDGRRLAYKKNVAGASKHWAMAVRSLPGGKETVLGEERSVDDQIEWLDDDTVLYGLSREDDPGATDVWSLDTTPASQPRLFIPQAWSPSVVR